MKRSVFVTVVLALTLAVCTSAWAGYGYYSSPSWSSGQGGSSSFGSQWWQNIMAKDAAFDSTITFIDNASYGWHSTMRGSSTYLSTHWLTSQVKKAHCRANGSSSARATCWVN